MIFNEEYMIEVKMPKVDGDYIAEILDKYFSKTDKDTVEVISEMKIDNKDKDVILYVNEEDLEKYELEYYTFVIDNDDHDGIMTIPGRIDDILKTLEEKLSENELSENKLSFIDKEEIKEASSLAYANKRNNIIRKVEKKHGKLSHLDYDLYQWAMFRCVSWANKILSENGKKEVKEEPPTFKTKHIEDTPVAFMRDPKAVSRTEYLMKNHKEFNDYMNLYLTIRELATGETIKDHKEVEINTGRAFDSYYDLHSYKEIGFDDKALEYFSQIFVGIEAIKNKLAPIVHKDFEAALYNEDLIKIINFLGIIDGSFKVMEDILRKRYDNEFERNFSDLMKTFKMIDDMIEEYKK